MLLCVSMLSITSVIKTFHMGGKPSTALTGRKYKPYELFLCFPHLPTLSVYHVLTSPDYAHF